MEEFELIFLGFDYPIQTVTDTKKCELYTVQINIILIYFYDNSTNMFYFIKYNVEFNIFPEKKKCFQNNSV